MSNLDYGRVAQALYDLADALTPDLAPAPPYPFGERGRCSIQHTSGLRCTLPLAPTVDGNGVQPHHGGHSFNAAYGQW